MADAPKSDDEKRDEVLRKMLNTPPKRNKPDATPPREKKGAETKPAPKG